MATPIPARRSSAPALLVVRAVLALIVVLNLSGMAHAMDALLDHDEATVVVATDDGGCVSVSAEAHEDDDCFCLVHHCSCCPPMSASLDEGSWALDGARVSVVDVVVRERVRADGARRRIERPPAA